MSSQPFGKKWHLYKKASAMSKITKGIMFIVLLVTSICFSQNDCIDFKDYEESQEWIKKVNSLDSSEKKNEILKRINCENILYGRVSFNLHLYISNFILFPNTISKNAINTIEKIEAENFILVNSYCEKKELTFCRCNLGALIIRKNEKPIINELKNITIKPISRKKNKISITLISNKKSEINLNVESFSNKNQNILNKKIKLKRGKNKIKIKTDNELKIIELEQNNLKTIFIQ